MKNKAAQELGKKGGTTTKKKYGKKHFKEIGKKAAKVRWGKTKPAVTWYLYQALGILFLGTLKTNEKRLARLLRP